MRLALLLGASWIVGAVALPPLDARGLPAPDLVLAALGAAAVARGPRWGAWVGLAVGLLVDLVALGRPGPTAPAYVLAGWAAGALGRRLVARTLGLVAAVSLGGLLAEFALPAFAAVAGLAVGLAPWRAAAEALLVGLLAPAAAFLDRPPPGD